MKIIQWLLLAFALFVKVLADKALVITDNPVVSEESTETGPKEALDHSLFSNIPSRRRVKQGKP
jgi:hypothetical protein